MKSLKILTFILSFGIMAPVSAKLIQIIHTNDLHSYFEGTRKGDGGYARIKTVVDKLRADALAQGIPSLYLDAGDFGEGSSFYFSNQGVDSLRALDVLGVDAAVLGNHDYILGGKILSEQIKAAKLKAPILSANLEGKSLMDLKGIIPDYVDFPIDGMKVRVFGLTTTEIHFQYPLLPMGYISSSHNAGIRMAKKAVKDNVDFLIALTHTGISTDQSLVRKSTSIDLIVGGHDHYRFDKPILVQNRNGEMIPIVQTGAHGASVGSLIVDLHGKGEAKVIDYKLHDIDKEIPEDHDTREFVGSAYHNRDLYFGRSFEEVIGVSTIPLSGPGANTDTSKACWSRHVARITRTVANADIGMQFDIFQGEEIPAGDIRFGDLIDNFPHFRTWGDKGWSVTRSHINGWILKKLLSYLTLDAAYVSVTLDGLQARSTETNKLVPYSVKNHSPRMALMNGERIKNMQLYSVALPSEISFGFNRTTSLAKILLWNSKKIPNSDYWTILEDYIRTNSPLECLKD